MILVLDAISDDYGMTLELQSDKKIAMIRRTEMYVQVICRNAANAVWQGSGKHFHGDNAWKQAIDAYKSSEMKAMIRFARQEMESGELFLGLSKARRSIWKRDSVSTAS